MNTTFTTCATKAKQFLNLLQGYTKGIRLTTILILLLMGATNAWAGYNVHWKGNVFFRVPDNWNISTYDEIQISVTRTIQVSGTALHIEYLGEMTRVGDTRLYYIWVEENHSSWNQTEYVLFTANTNLWNSGNITISSNSQYTIPINYDFTNSEYPYLYNPTSEGNGAAVTGSYSDNGNTYEDRRKNLLQKKQTINLYTNGTASNNGGSVTISGTYITGNTTTGTNDVTSSGKDVSYDNLIGATVKLTATPTSGYEFDGWYTEAAGGTAISTSATYTYTCKGELTLYARFKGKKYTVTLNNQSATTAGSTLVQATYGSAMPSATMPQKTGYTFNGYFDAESGGNQYYKADGTSAQTWNKTSHTTLYAQWTANTYTITYKDQGGSDFSGTHESGYPTTHTYGTETTLKDPTRLGFIFGGWFTSSDCTGTAVTSLGATAINANITLYAKWEERKLFINTNWMEGWWSEEMTHTTNTTYTYTKIAMQASVAPYFFRFLDAWGGNLEYGWDDLKEVTTTNSDIVQNIESRNDIGYINFSLTRKSDVRITLTLQSPNDDPMPTVQIDATPYCNITLDQTGCAQPGTQTVEVKSGNAMPEIDLPGAPTGYIFGGYYDQKDGAGKKYYNADGTSESTWDKTVDATLYPKWEAITYNITYQGLEGATHTNATKYTIEDAITFSEPSTRNGYTFAGWYPASIEKGSTGDKTITAQWTEKPGTTVYLKANDMWKSDGAKLAVYAWNNNTENTWVDVDYDDCIGNILRAEIPAKYDRIKFVRLKPSSADGYDGENNGYNFANAWNQTNDLNVPTNNKNLYDLTQEYIYLKPNSNWTTDGARFAARFYQSSGSYEVWKDMTDADGDGYYSCEKPDGVDWVIFCRMNPTTSANNWNNRWNQSADQGIPENNLFTVNDGQWGGKGEDNNKDGATGHWDNNHWDNSQWTTYTAPTFDVTISAATNGTIKVAYNSQTYTSGQTISNVPIHTELNVTFTPATGYVLTNPQVTYADQIAEGVYSICGPSVISAAFTPRGETRVIYLRPNDDWLHDDAIFVAHAWNGDGNSDYALTTKDNDYTGSYSCTIDSKYDHILFARLDPADKGNINLENAWNKTKDLEIVESIYTTNNQTRFAIGAQIVEGEDKDLYDGEWETNSPIWGITADFNNWHAEDAVFRGYPGNVDILLHSGTHEFLLYNIKTGSYFHNNGTYTRNYSGQWWTMNEQNNCKLVADVDNAFYHFQMQYVTQVGEFKNQISVTYPTDDVYYVMYKENDNKERISYAITKADNRLDTISFFVDANKDPYIFLLDENKAIVGDGYRILATGGSNPGGAMIQGRRNTAELVIGDGCGVTESGVYNFVVTQTEGEQRFEPTLTHAYKGNYYVRTDAATGGWNAYKQNGNKMTYTSYADKKHNFDHYYCKWITSSESSYSNVKFCVANDYSHKLSDEWDGDEIIEKVDVPTGCLPEDANVRFGWDSKTNELSRAYISGSAYAKDRFLVLTGNKDLKDIEGGALNISGLEANEALFADKQNWIYQLDVQANSNTEITLTAQYNGKVQTFFGTQKGVMQATNDKYHKVRMIYDFKTNNLIAAWLLNTPKQETEAESVASNMLIIREDQGEANQINFTKNQDMEIFTAYAVMTFTKNHVLGLEDKASLSKWQRTDYWVSFPFDVNLSNVFGFGEYGDQWIMLYYDGAERAEKGGWKGTTYWKYITNRNEVLQAGVGYVLKLNPTKMEKQAFANNATDASLFFPSQGIPTIINHEPTQINVPAHTCEINRDTPGGDRRILDSHWNLIGVPGYANLNEVNTKYTTGNQAENVSFYYAYNAADNSYEAAADKANFKNMYAYMVQFAGTIDWKNDPQFNNIPQQLAARRNSNSNKPEKLTLRLEIAQGEDVADQTFVQMQQEGATHEFDMNLDLTKIINSGANIYTLTNDRIQAAGNALPMDEAMVVPVGVKIDAEGEYTFRMPDGTEGMVVELVDYETNNRTNLLLTDYTVTLPKGTSENRFALHIQPQKDVVTSLENIGEGVNNGEAVNKYLIDGKLIIRTADGIFDAQGHRL